MGDSLSRPIREFLGLAKGCDAGLGLRINLDHMAPGLGDSESDGAEVRDRYSASDEDPLIVGGGDSEGESIDQLS